MQGLFRYRNNYIDAFMPDDRLQGIEVGRRIGIGRRHPDRSGHAAGGPADMQSEWVCHDHAGTSLVQGACEFEGLWQPPKCEKYRLGHLLRPQCAVQQG